jgi:hypothetical protein
MEVKLFLGLAVLFALFLKWISGKAEKDLRNETPINQGLNLGSRSSLLPYIDAQAQHETGNFTSRLATDQNNLFGMKKPYIRAFLGTAKGAGEFLKYKDRAESVQDLILWMEHTGFPETVSGSADYVQQLKKRKYFEDNLGTYTKGVNAGLKRLEAQGVTGFNITYF